MTCDEIYDAVVEGREGNSVLFDMAACFLRGFDPEKLRSMLRSSDLGIVSDGLFVAGEIGPLASNYIDDFRVLAESGDQIISTRALHLLGVYEQFDKGDYSSGAR